MSETLTNKSILRAGSMSMPIIGLGTWQSNSETELEVAVEKAIEVGYRHIDTAYMYLNELFIGNILKKIFSKGQITRKDLFITTKLPPIGNRPEHVEEFLNKSLTNLQLDYVDLYIIHFPAGIEYGEEFFPLDEEGNVRLDMNTDLIALWKAMEQQVISGRTKSIGVSNFNLRQLKKIVENSVIRPSNLQIEMHLYLQQKELKNYCDQNGIAICAYAPLGSPGLKNHPKLKTPMELPDLMDNPTVKELSAKFNKLPSQILLRFLIQLGVAVIPKSSKPQRILENFQIFDFKLSTDDMDSLKKLDKGNDGRLFQLTKIYKGVDRHPEYPISL